MKSIVKVATAALSLVVAGEAAALNVTPYYLFDGDSDVGYEIVNAVVVNSFATFDIGYPVAIRDTIWLGERDDGFAREYTLGGVATGNASVGGSAFYQLLDGATGDGVNYGVECCDGVDSVTIANADWADQRVLFDLPVGFGGDSGGSGILFDPTDQTLWVSDFADTVTQFSLAGDVLGGFSLAGAESLVGLAYEVLTDTFWATDTSGMSLMNFNRSGTVLSDTPITGASISNPYGGEMAVTSFGGGGGTVVPVPAAIWGLLAGLGGLGMMARRRRG